MGYLFVHGPEDDRAPPKNNRTYRRKRHNTIKEADEAVVVLFSELQTIWRDQHTLRRVHQRECVAWDALMKCLLRLPPPN